MVGQYALLEKCVLCALHVFIGIFKVFRNQLGSLGIFSAAGSWSMVVVTHICILPSYMYIYIYIYIYIY